MHWWLIKPCRTNWSGLHSGPTLYELLTFCSHVFRPTDEAPFSPKVLDNFLPLLGLCSRKDASLLTVVSTRRSATLVWEPRGGNCMCLTTRMWASAFFKKTFPLLLLFIAAVWLRSQEPQSHPPPLCLSLSLSLSPWKVNSFNLPQLKSSLLFTKCLCCCREMVQWILLTMHRCTALTLFSDCSQCLVCGYFGVFF